MVASTVVLSTTVQQQQHGNSAVSVVFLHGLDSSSRTWRHVMPQLDANSIALDLRGCGTSDLGVVEEFSQAALVQDVHSVLQSNEKKIVLVGHSLGGRIAMAYAAKYPEEIAALVIEDMDVIKRPIETSPVPIFYGNEFDRRFASQQDAINALQNAGYPRDGIEKWIAEGRIRCLDNGDWWSDVNPVFRRLCYQTILDTELGLEVWKLLCKETFPCHLLVAGETIGDASSLELMQETMERLQVHNFPTATHSIHSSAQDDFLSTLRDIIASV